MTDKEELLKSYKEYIEQIRSSVIKDSKDKDDVKKAVEYICELMSIGRKTDNNNERDKQ